MIGQRNLIRGFISSTFLLIVFVLSPFQGAAEPTFQEAFDKHNSIMLLIDPGDGTIVDANPAASRFYGYSRDIFRTMSIQQINQLTAEQVADERNLAKTEGRNFFIFRHKLADESVRTVEVHSVPLEFDGRKVLYSIIRDISKERALEKDLWHYQSRLEEMVDLQTQELQTNHRSETTRMTFAIIVLVVLILWLVVSHRRGRATNVALIESEQQKLDLLNNTSSVIYIKDLDGRYLFVNKKYEDLFHVTNEGVKGKTSHDIFPPEPADAFRTNDLKAIESETPLELEEIVPQKDGNHTYISVKFSLRNASGEIYAVCGISTDITERKLSEVQLKDAKEEAEKANRAKSEFLANMSHELRTPLNAILGFAQMMKYDPRHDLAAPQTEHIENILDGGNHLLELVNELLDLAQIEADHVSLSLEEVNAIEVVDDCLNLTRPLGSTRCIEIENRICNKQLPEVRTDRTRFKQALLNLLSNAVKFNKDGGTVTIDGDVIEDGFLRVSITDTGSGIAQDDHHGVFKIFNRLGKSSMIAKEGTGIGLPVTKMLVERMSGRVGFESKEGAGSTFWIELPLASNENVLIWEDRLRVGVDAIDRDHQKLVFLTNQISYPTVDSYTLNAVIEEMIDYTIYHFKREEAIMDVCGYPDLAEHRAAHDQLTKQVKDLSKKWNENHDTEVIDKLRLFLRDWLINHIAKVDTGLAPHTKGKNQKIVEALNSVELAHR